MSINEAKWTFFFVSLCFQNDLLFALDVFQIPCWNCLELFPFLVHCGFRIRNFHRLRHWNELVYQVVMSHRCKSFACNAIFMILGLRRFHSLPCGFTRFHFSATHRFGLLFFAIALYLFRDTWMNQPYEFSASQSPSSSFLPAFLRISLYSSSSGSIK